jgi:hypothetical protein
VFEKPVLFGPTKLEGAILNTCLSRVEHGFPCNVTVTCTTHAQNHHQLPVVPAAHLSPGSVITVIYRFRVARIIFKRTKKHVAATMICRLGEIILVKCQKQAFSFNKREAKVYCYAFLHVLKRDTCIKHGKNY